MMTAINFECAGLRTFTVTSGVEIGSLIKGNLITLSCILTNYYSRARKFRMVRENLVFVDNNGLTLNWSGTISLGVLIPTAMSTPTMMRMANRTPKSLIL